MPVLRFTSERGRRWTTRALRVAACLAVIIAAALSASAGDPTTLENARTSFATDVRPLIAKYCDDCHSGDLIEAQVDLGAVTDFDAVRRDPDLWQRVHDMIAHRQMPPADAAPLPDSDRQSLLDWLEPWLAREAALSDGDPGRVVLRRLNNAEYTNTIRDLTGVPTLDPAREFPADSAAGEGFTNTGAALVMSPALITKYFDAAKEVADHVVLLPDGFRFSPSTSRRDWTEESLARIRDIYHRYSGAGGGTAVNLQGIQFETNQAGRLPIERYLAATLERRDDLQSGRITPEQLATERHLSPQYLALLWDTLHQPDGDSVLVDRLRSRWQSATPADAITLSNEIAGWQRALWKFNPVGQISRQYGGTLGPERWMEPASPLVPRQDVRFKLTPPADGSDLTLYLTASDAGDGSELDLVVWENPRLVSPGRTDLPLRDVRSAVAALKSNRERIARSAADCLAAVAAAPATLDDAAIAALASQHAVEPAILAAWLELLGLAGPPPLNEPLTAQQSEFAGYSFIRGWVGADALSVVANSSDDHVRIPGNMRPHSVAVHPAPTQQIVISWRSPAATTLTIAGTVQHAHPECGNGVTWSLELRRGRTSQQLAAGIAQGGTPVVIGPVADVAAQPDDLIALVVGPRDANHSCDLTAIDLSLTSAEHEWILARDVAPDILAANPHADSFGNPAVWHFSSEPVGGASQWNIPAGSLLARWQSAPAPDERITLADSLQQLLTGAAPPQPADGPDATLLKLLASANGPLLSTLRLDVSAKPPAADDDSATFGLDPQLFGVHPAGGTIAAENLCVRAPSILEVRLPADLVDGCEFVTSGVLDIQSGGAGSVQLEVSSAPPASDDLSPTLPIIVADSSEARSRFEASFNDIRNLFPPVLCYAQIVPVDEVITLNLFYREDDHLRRLMLSDAEAAELDRHWDELLYASREPLLLLEAYEQLYEYATQDRPDKVIEFTPLRGPITDRAAAFRQRIVAAEPGQLDQLLAFAAQAFRRPLGTNESLELRQLYSELRRQDLPHDEAFKLTLARVIVSPEFLYRLEQPAPGPDSQPVNDYELATRLSYFLWSSLPDAELLLCAADGRLHEDEVLLSQTRRMLADPRAQRMAREFAAQWLHVYQFDQLDEKSSSHFPMFAALRDDMYQETLLFFADLFQHDRPILNILDADYTFLNADLAAHYGIPNVAGPEWRRVEGVKQYGRGGILTQAAPLSQQSGASRTSPILRGNWLSEVVLGEKLPRPPKGVPVLPETPPEGRTERQLIELHSSDPACAKCHARIDPLGFALEQFDAIGRKRDRDAAGLPIDSNTTLMDGTALNGLTGLQTYLTESRRRDFLRQFNKKLLGYALGRSIQFSDGPLLDRIDAALQSRENHVSAALEAIVLSRQFREIRGAEFE